MSFCYFEIVMDRLAEVPPDLEDFFIRREGFGYALIEIDFNEYPNAPLGLCFANKYGHLYVSDTRPDVDSIAAKFFLMSDRVLMVNGTVVEEKHVSAVARKGGGRGGCKLVMTQSSHRICLAASLPNLSESSLAGWAPVLRLRCSQPRTVRARYANPQSPPAKLDSDKFGDEAARPNRWLD